MKYKLLISVGVILALFTFNPFSTKAFDITSPGGSNSICSGAGSSSSYCTDVSNGGSNNITGPNGILTDVINVLSYITGIVAVIVLMIGAFRFIVSGGDSAQVSSARSMILYALVGIVIVGSAQTIMYFLIGRL